MLYTTITIGGKDYKCRLSAKSLVDIERKIKTNPLNIVMEMANNQFPMLETALIMWHSSLQEYNHGISMDDTYNLYDKYCEEGGSYVSFIEDIFVPLLQSSGLIPKEAETTKDAKN